MERRKEKYARRLDRLVDESRREREGTEVLDCGMEAALHRCGCLEEDLERELRATRRIAGGAERRMRVYRNQVVAAAVFVFLGSLVILAAVMWQGRVIQAAVERREWSKAAATLVILPEGAEAPPEGP